MQCSLERGAYFNVDTERSSAYYRMTLIRGSKVLISGYCEIFDNAVVIIVPHYFWNSSGNLHF